LSGRGIKEGKKIKNMKKEFNINRYNKYLFIFETVLLIGLLENYLSEIILELNINVYLNVLLIMLSIGFLFTLAFRFLEPLARDTIVWLVRFNENKILRIVAHALILICLFYLYTLAYFDVVIFS
jgi:hypothetical protein